MLNNLFRVCWNLKNADIVCYMLTLFVSLQQENSKQYEKLVKMVNIEGENLCIFWRTWGNSIKFSGKMWLMIILKVTKNQGFILSLENIFLETLQGEDQIDPPPPPAVLGLTNSVPAKFQPMFFDPLVIHWWRNYSPQIGWMMPCLVL